MLVISHVVITKIITVRRLADAWITENRDDGKTKSLFKFVLGVTRRPYGKAGSQIFVTT